MKNHPQLFIKCAMTQRNVRMPLHSQQGVALIVVLFVLVLIMLGGAIAVRQSNTDLKAATADQINTLLLQSSDSGNQKLEAMVNGSSSSDAYKDITSMGGALGHFLLNTDNARNEFIYCYNPRLQRYLAANATIKKPGSDSSYWSGLNNGVCDYTKADSYTNARQTTMTQMHVTVTPPDINADPFSSVVLGKESENRTSQKFKFDIRALSVLPAYNEPKNSEGECLRKSSIPIEDASHPGEKVTPTLACTRESKTPSKALYQQVDVENLSSATPCIAFGKGAGLDSACIL